MKSKKFKKIALNKRVISTLSLENVKGGKTTVEPPIGTIDPTHSNHHIVQTQEMIIRADIAQLHK